MANNTINLSLKQVLEYIILGIRLGNNQAAIDLAQDAIDILDNQQQKQAITTANKKDNTVWGI